MFSNEAKETYVVCIEYFFNEHSVPLKEQKKEKINHEQQIQK